MLVGGLLDEYQCDNLAARLFDAYDTDGTGKVELSEISRVDNQH